MTPFCVGDCNADSFVTVSELILCVNIALSMAPIEECPALDANGDQTSSASELVIAVNHALTGCLQTTAER